MLWCPWRDHAEAQDGAWERPKSGAAEQCERGMRRPAIYSLSLRAGSRDGAGASDGASRRLELRVCDGRKASEGDGTHHGGGAGGLALRGGRVRPPAGRRRRHRAHEPTLRLWNGSILEKPAKRLRTSCRGAPGGAGGSHGPGAGPF